MAINFIQSHYEIPRNLLEACTIQSNSSGYEDRSFCASFLFKFNVDSVENRCVIKAAVSIFNRHFDKQVWRQTQCHSKVTTLLAAWSILRSFNTIG